MTFQTLKATVLQHVTADWVKANFGDFRKRETWQAALDQCQKFKVQKFSVDYLTKLNKLQLVQLAQAEGLVIDSRIKATDIRAKLLEVPA